MFKKKVEKPEIKKEIEEVAALPEYNSQYCILAALRTLQHALKTGQLVNPGDMPLSVKNTKLYALDPTMDIIGHFQVGKLNSIDEFYFVPKEVIKETLHKAKLERLDTLRKEQAEKVNEIEKLARELGEK